MMNEFERLATLYDADPPAYRAEVARMRANDPARFEAFLAYCGSVLEATHEAEDRPLTEAEIEDAIALTAAELGWTRRRVMGEGIMRLRAALDQGGFRPVTPEEFPDKRAGKYRRRRSSLQAIALEDVRGLLEKHERKRTLESGLHMAVAPSRSNAKQGTDE